MTWNLFTLCIPIHQVFKCIYLLSNFHFATFLFVLFFHLWQWSFVLYNQLKSYSHATKHTTWLFICIYLAMRCMLCSRRKLQPEQTLDSSAALHFYNENQPSCANAMVSLMYNKISANSKSVWSHNWSGKFCGWSTNSTNLLTLKQMQPVHFNNDQCNLLRAAQINKEPRTNTTHEPSISLIS